MVGKDQLHGDQSIIVIIMALLLVLVAEEELERIIVFMAITVPFILVTKRLTATPLAIMAYLQVEIILVIFRTLVFGNLL